MWMFQAIKNSLPQTGSAYSVTVSAAQIMATTPATPARHGVLVQSIASNVGNVYIGGSGVTTSNGIELIPGASIVYPVTDPSTIFAISAAGGQSLRISWV